MYLGYDMYQVPVPCMTTSDIAPAGVSFQFKRIAELTQSFVYGTYLFLSTQKKIPYQYRYLWFR